MERDELTKLKYPIRCKIKKKRLSGIDSKGKLCEDDVVLLIPIQSTSMQSFLYAWLPDDPSETFEINTFIPHPINSYCRCKIRRKNKDCDEHHLFVMSHGCEQELLKLDGSEIHLTVLSENDDEETSGFEV